MVRTVKITPIQLAKRVERWQNLLSPLGVGHFRITAVHLVEHAPHNPRAKASVWCPSHYDNAEFWFTYELLESCDEQELDETIIHEWLHVAWRDMDEALEAVEKWMPDSTYEDFESVIDHEREGLIDRTARALYALHNAH